MLDAIPTWIGAPLLQNTHKKSVCGCAESTQNAMSLQMRGDGAPAAWWTWSASETASRRRRVAASSRCTRIPSSGFPCSAVGVAVTCWTRWRGAGAFPARTIQSRGNQHHRVSLLSHVYDALLFVEPLTHYGEGWEPCGGHTIQPQRWFRISWLIS